MTAAAVSSQEDRFDAEDEAGLESLSLSTPLPILKSTKVFDKKDLSLDLAILPQRQKSGTVAGLTLFRCFYIIRRVKERRIDETALCCCTIFGNK